MERNKNKRWELQVYSRTRGHIEALLPGVHVEEKPGAEFGYCASVHQAVVAEMLAGEVRSIGYEDFNDSIGDRKHREVCASVARAHRLACRGRK